jgi:tetratricopeptide (TPR) repeat protein
MRAPSSGTLVLAALVCVAALPARAAAEPTEGTPAAGTGTTDEARRLFQKAELSFNLGKFEDALADYQAAYQAKPLTGFLFNIAQCYRNLGNWERARFFYRRYLTLEPRSPNRHRVEDLVAEMTDKLDKQQAQPSVAPPPASTSPVAASSTATTETPSAGAPSVAPPPAAVPPLPEPKVESTAGASSGSPTASSTLVASPDAEPESRPAYKRWWFWTGVGAVVVGGAVAAVLLTRPATRTPGSLDPIDGR